MTVQLSTGPEDVDRCFPVLSQLRPHLRLEDFREQVRRQAEHGYCLAFIADQGEVVGVAGFRISECLAWGKHVFVDDLVTAQDFRGCGIGGQLLKWLIGYAERHDCGQLHLDSGVQRFDAHRFYLRHKMHIASHHFSLELNK